MNESRGETRKRPFDVGSVPHSSTRSMRALCGRFFPWTTSSRVPDASTISSILFNSRFTLSISVNESSVVLPTVVCAVSFVSSARESCAVGIVVVVLLVALLPPSSSTHSSSLSDDESIFCTVSTSERQSNRAFLISCLKKRPESEVFDFGSNGSPSQAQSSPWSKDTTTRRSRRNLAEACRKDRSDALLFPLAPVSCRLSKATRANEELREPTTYSKDTTRTSASFFPRESNASSRAACS
mmetsp:Transcript_4956/g.15550  ORF Transcript_4956/g.15550 Transcript_4956/m.15550 type:complete len:241 (-) Transcript_4956:374-1096(-)